MKPGKATLVLLALGALFVPSWPVQLVCFLGLAANLLAALHSRLVAGAIHVERDTTELSCHARDTVEVGITIRNASLLPVPVIAVWDRPGALTPLDPTRAAFSLGPRDSVRLRYAARSSERGVFDLGPISVSSGDPLGLYPWQRTIDRRCRVTVYPAIRAARRHAVAGLPGGDLRLRDPVFEDPTRFAGVREYVPGDDLRRIHWKASARLGALHTVEYEPATTAPSLVLLDLRADRYPLRLRHHLVERAVETAAALTVAAAEARQATGLWAAASIEGAAPIALPGRGIGHAIHILGLLARVEPSAEDTDAVDVLLGSGVRVPAGARVCLVGPSPSDEWIRLARTRLPRGALLEVHQLGAGDAARRRRVPPGVRLRSVDDYGAGDGDG